jgi:hypothetical protein
MSMKAPQRLVLRSAYEDNPLPVALFKTSLRAWQTGYQARRAAQEREAEKGIQTGRARQDGAGLFMQTDGCPPRLPERQP